MIQPVILSSNTPRSWKKDSFHNSLIALSNPQVARKSPTFVCIEHLKKKERAKDPMKPDRLQSKVTSYETLLTANDVLVIEVDELPLIQVINNLAKYDCVIGQSTAESIIGSEVLEKRFEKVPSKYRKE